MSARRAPFGKKGETGGEYVTMSTMGLLNDPEYWRKRAEEARARVEDWAESAHKHTMLDVANTYERMADLAERRLDSEKKPLSATDV
jgi:hypothetical protein